MRSFIFFMLAWFTCAANAELSRVSVLHPRLLGSRAELQALAEARPQEFQRVLNVAKSRSGEDYPRGISLALAAAITGNAEFAREAHRIAMKYVNGPIRQGHVPFGHDLALCGLIYDLCHEAWPEEDRAKFHDYLNKTVDANVNSETHVFHNGWYGYKNWGIGIAAYACYHENPRAPEIIKTLEHDYRTRAAPALELAGAGGGWAEGYYIHYWLYEWLFFCEVARRCGGVDYYEMAPAFYRNRALASAFETYPGIGEYGTRRMIPMGDGGGRVYGGDRDKALSARRILASRFREDPLHQALHTFNESTPRSGTGLNAYKDFLWHETSIPKAELHTLPLSHLSSGPGFVYARSSWDEDATHFFFKCGDRFTAHQHLDNGHFLIYRGGELAGDGGHYDSFGSRHDVNYHLRSIAHNTLLVFDPHEKWPAIRAGKVTGNDGGQHHNWPHHNGAASDPQEWQRRKHLYDIAEIEAFHDGGGFVYVAGDLARSYASNKVSKAVRQIVFLRPGTFVIFDQVSSANPDFKKTWLLHAMKPPVNNGSQQIISNGGGKLFVQTLLPENPEVRLATGNDLYRYGGENYPPTRNTGPAPECRIEISPRLPALDDIFLHVLTATDAGVDAAPVAQMNQDGSRVTVWIAGTRVEFNRSRVGGEIEINGRRAPLQRVP
jgi:hypothetical protein